jgi:hypothetical protein
MSYSITPTSGINLDDKVQTTTQVIGTTTVTVPANGPLGSQVFGSDGRLYVLAQANASIPASTAVCTVNATTFLVTATGGSYLSPAVALVSGDVAWFSEASVG